MQDMSKYDRLIKRIAGLVDLEPKNSKLFLNAATHSSYANERKAEKLSCNERLEFLGDSVLNLVISDYLFKNYPGLPEGELTKARAGIVCEPSLAKCANEMDLGGCLLLSKGEELTGGKNRASILSDAFEALIAAIYIDGGEKGYENAQRFILPRMKEIIEECIRGAANTDYKTRLQEIIQHRSGDKVTYRTIEEKGPDHAKQFTVDALIAGRAMGRGKGRNKKEAEQNAAKNTLERME